MEYEVVESWDGFKWAIRRGDRYEHDKVVLSKGELSVLKALTLLASKDKIFVDVGAHVGYYTVRMAKLYRHVYAFEPDPENRDNLVMNIELNNLSNVTVYPYALGDRNGVMKFYLKSTVSTLLPVPDAWSVIDVEVRRMDDVLSCADVVKIDVEAWELPVLRGMERIINDCRPTLVIEHHDFGHYRINTYLTIKQMLKERGYIMLFLTTPHRLYYHRSNDISRIKPLIVHHWIAYCIYNLERGRPWYYSLPYTWWWGMNLIDFIQELPEHIDKEDLWTELLDRIDE